jgi:hypothetical protein
VGVSKKRYDLDLEKDLDGMEKDILDEIEAKLPEFPIGLRD